MLLKLKTLFKTRDEVKKIFDVQEFNQSDWLKQHVEFNTQKRIEAEKVVTKTEKRCAN